MERYIKDAHIIQPESGGTRVVIVVQNEKDETRIILTMKEIRYLIKKLSRDNLNNKLWKI